MCKHVLNAQVIIYIIISEAKTKYPAPTLEDLNSLQKDLKKIFRKHAVRTEANYRELIIPA